MPKRKEVYKTVKVLHVTPSFYPAHVYGGPIESVYQLCSHMVRQGCEIRVLTTDANGPHKVLEVEKDREVELAEGLRVRYCRRSMRHAVSSTLLRFLPSYIRWADLVHVTAVYSFPTIPALLACTVLRKPAVWSPRGSLSRWEGSRRRLSKAIWERTCQSVAPKQLVVHVTSEEEARECTKRFSRVETIVIPNGVEIPRQARHVDCNGTLRLLYLGRLHPKKGIENLLDGFRIWKEKSSIPSTLTIVGSGDEHYTEAIRDRIGRLNLSNEVAMRGQVVGNAKHTLFENVDLVIVPSHTENFGMVVGEALAHGVPVIASKGTPWRELEDIGCGLWVENAPESLATAIEQMSRMPLQKMGQRGRQWMQQEFYWGRQAKTMVELYEKLVVGKWQIISS